VIAAMKLSFPEQRGQSMPMVRASVTI